MSFLPRTGLYLENVNNTLVRGVNGSHNYRQGLRVITATNRSMLIEDSSFTDPNGTAPMCGVDLFVDLFVDLKPDWFYHLCDFPLFLLSLY